MSTERIKGHTPVNAFPSVIAAGNIGTARLLTDYFGRLKVQYEDLWPLRALLFDRPLWHDSGVWVVYQDVCGEDTVIFHDLMDKYVAGGISDYEIKKLVDTRTKYVPNGGCGEAVGGTGDVHGS